MVVTCLGVSGSGKTIFLGSLLDSLNSPANARDGFYITADTSVKGGDIFSDTLLLRPIGPGSNLDRIGRDGFKGYTEGTKETTLRKFALVQGREAVLDVWWLDYKGGLITGESGNSKEREELYTYLDECTAIVVFLDGYRIATASSVNQARRWVGADSITKILSHFEKSKEGETVNVLFVLTQCDAIENQEWVAENYRRLKSRAKEVLGGFIDLVNENPLWHCGIVATSAIGVGQNRRKIIKEKTFSYPAKFQDEIIDEPEPFGVVAAFYWLVRCHDVVKIRNAEMSIQRVKKSIENVDENIRQNIKYLPPCHDSVKSDDDDVYRFIESSNVAPYIGVAAFFLVFWGAIFSICMMGGLLLVLLMLRKYSRKNKWLAERRRLEEKLEKKKKERDNFKKNLEEKEKRKLKEGLEEIEMLVDKHKEFN
jgi:hypothetical protein